MDLELKLCITSNSREQCIGGYASQFINNVEQVLVFLSRKIPKLLIKRNPGTILLYPPN